MSEAGSWIAEIVREAKSEWGIKGVSMVGIWIVGPITGEISFGSFWLIAGLLGLSLVAVFLNVLYQDFIRPLSPAVNLEEYTEQETDDADQDERDTEQDREVSTETA